MTILCLASYEKGHAFLREAKRQGCTVILLTSVTLQGKADWPMDSIDEIFYMPDQNHEWNRADTVKAVSYLARTRPIDRIVALDDFDVETAATLREHLRLPGMGETTVRHFRDKLAMRMKARDAGLNVPNFVHVLNYDSLRRFMEDTPAPWVLKPRSMAGAIGIKKIHHADEFWPAIELLGDMQSFYLLEQFIPGDIFHVDCIVSEKQVVFAIASGYGRPPMEVSHGGGIFTTRILERDSEDALRLVAENQRVMAALGMVRGVSHTEFIKAKADGRVYFLETSARVGGAHIVELVEAATGLNLWAEWAKVEVAGADGGYRPPAVNQDYAGLLISLARQQRPDTSAYNDAEIVWRLLQDHHAGLIVKSPSAERVRELLSAYERRFTEDFYAYEPPREKPGH
jgi:glutathione synthase/RimK-type ligase-like ATP-grasp enzyme